MGIEKDEWTILFRAQLEDWYGEKKWWRNLNFIFILDVGEGKTEVSMKSKEPMSQTEEAKTEIDTKKKEEKSNPSKEEKSNPPPCKNLPNIP